MTTEPESKAPSTWEQKVDWLAVVRIVWMAVFMILVFLLGRSMMEHRFFQGGWIDQNGTLRP